MRYIRFIFVVSLSVSLFASFAVTGSSETSEHTLPLAGEWGFRLDPDDVGTTAGWFKADLPDTMRLPGSTDENGKGTLPEEHRTDRLSRVHPYVGVAWYSRDVTVPDAWAGKRVTLFLERCHWETTLYVDGEQVGMQNSLCVPHVYDTGERLKPGKHRIVLRVDNRVKIDIGGWGHSITDETQTNWNGIVGRIELRCSDPVWIDRVVFTPDAATTSIKVRVFVGNATGSDTPVRITVADSKEPVSFTAPPGVYEVDAVMPLSVDTPLWDEFNPICRNVSVTLSAEASGKKWASKWTEPLGIRFLTANSRRLVMNGRTLGLRGTLECAIFPKTGYPPTDVQEWRHLLGIAKDYGLNHIRFHSWCPPEAAFVAADEMGMMLQVECPIWVGDGKTVQLPERAAFFEAEANHIVDTYGNHASFCFMSLGNEILLGGLGDEPYLNGLLQRVKQRDARHLYTCSSAPYGERPNDDFFVAQGMPKGWIRGQGRIGIKDTSTDFDWDTELEETTRPVISHEIGQYAMYPDFGEIPKYTGPLRANNFKKFRDTLTSAGMADQAGDFFRASGKLSGLLYKDEIEAALRSRNLAGFALLDLHDFPGQGTALIGILNAFWESKGIYTPEEFRRFCSPVVPLARLPKREWTTDEKFSASVELANYGPQNFPAAEAKWKLSDGKGRVVASGTLPAASSPTGDVTRLGKIDAALDMAQAPCKLTVAVSITGASAENSWDIWVYPAAPPAPVPAGLLVSQAWDDKTKSALAEGAKVLLLPKAEKLSNTIANRFVPVFWSQMFAQTPNMGLLLDPKHGAFAAFPTENYSNWQWMDIAVKSYAFMLDGTPSEFRPVVQIVPDFNTNIKMGVMLETRVGPGRLFACSADIETNLEKRPAARQLRQSLLAYLASDRFNPKESLSSSTLDFIFQPSRISEFVTPAPDNLERASLHVLAGGKATMNKDEKWTQQKDEIVKLAEDTTYTVQGHVWKDSTGSSWVGNTIRVNVAIPKNFHGTLYARFHDWNNLRRRAHITFEEQNIGLLGDHAGAGLWLGLPVGRDQSADGQVQLTARVENSVNIMISELVLMPAQ